MKVVSEHTKKYVTIELDEEQLLAVVTALGMTTPSERTSEIRHFYKISNYKDRGTELYDSIANYLGLGTDSDDDAEPENDFWSDF
jgi:hypothetical protein